MFFSILQKRQQHGLCTVKLTNSSKHEQTNPIITLLVVTKERVQCQVRQDYDRTIFLRLLSKTAQPQALSIDQLLQYILYSLYIHMFSLSFRLLKHH